MSKQSSLLRYQLIIQKLRKGKFTFTEINDHLHLYDLAVSARTFKRDCEEIRSVLGFDIAFDFKAGSYSIATDAVSEVQNRMLEAFELFNALKVTDGLGEHLFFDQRRALGYEHLPPLLDAIKKKVIVRFSYRKFWDGITQRTVEPCALKESQNRWYLIAKEPNNDIIKTFGLDRITSLEITSQKYKQNKKIDFNRLFADSFGVDNNDEVEAQKVILLFNPEQGNYIKTYPLHHSQKVIVDSDDELQIELFVKPTFDFRQELLHHGADVEVISPKSLRDAIHMSLQQSLAYYG